MQDLHATRASLRAGQTTATAEIARAIEAAQTLACAHVFIAPQFDGARAEAAAAQATQPLAGLAFSVKDMFDIAGQPTPAGSVVLRNAPPAAQDSVAVARLRAAGGALMGRTNMSEFAFSGVGVNPHHGTPANACDAQTPRVPGGSSSGAAISVATGAAFIGLGSDTGGSIRIPAALNGLVGFKNTARRVPADGAVPLSTTLDTVCAITRSVRDAVLAHEILAAREVQIDAKALPERRLAVVRDLFCDDIEPAVAAAFEDALERLRQAGAHIEEIALPPLGELAAINAGGGFSPVEAYAWHRQLLERSGAGYDPRVVQRILRGATMATHDYIALIQARQDWIRRMEAAIAPYDGLLCPTLPIVAPPIAGVAPGPERDTAFFRVNGLLLRNPAVINILDGCAITIPCPVAAGALPVGLMLWHGAMQDDRLLSLALQAEEALLPR